jgi:hypothetical protein
LSNEYFEISSTGVVLTKTKENEIKAPIIAPKIKALALEICVFE